MSVFRHFKLPQLLRKRKSDDNSIVNIPRFDCKALAVKERLGQGSFGDIYNVDKRGLTGHTTPTVRGISKFAVFPFRSLDLFCRFTLVMKVLGIVL